MKTSAVYFNQSNAIEKIIRLAIQIANIRWKEEIIFYIDKLRRILSYDI